MPKKIMRNWKKKFENKFIADDILDCIPLANWEEKVELSKELRKYSANDYIEIEETYKEKLGVLLENI